MSGYTKDNAFRYVLGAVRDHQVRCTKCGIQLIIQSFLALGWQNAKHFLKSAIAYYYVPLRSIRMERSDVLVFLPCLFLFVIQVPFDPSSRPRYICMYAQGPIGMVPPLICRSTFPYSDGFQLTHHSLPSRVS